MSDSLLLRSSEHAVLRRNMVADMVTGCYQSSQKTLDVTDQNENEMSQKKKIHSISVEDQRQLWAPKNTTLTKLLVFNI